MKIMQTEKHHSLGHPRSNFMGWGHKFDIIFDNKTPLSVGCFFCSVKCPLQKRVGIVNTDFVDHETANMIVP